MKQLYCLVFLALASICAAQSNGEDTIPIFNLDDFYVEPKMTLTVGFRGLTGPKVAFSGSTGVSSLIASTQGQGDVNATGIIRDYHDGYVAIDQRVDADGNALTDGKTNTWAMLDLRQATEVDGAIAMHTYSAQVYDNKTRNKDPGNSYGTELVVARDMGKIGDRIEWKIFAGMSINNVNASTRDFVTATVTTLTDLYLLNGQTAPTAVPYIAPSTLVAEDGTVTDTSLLLGQKPDSRSTSTVTNDVSVASFWRLKGTYLTFRAGPSLTFKLSERFRITVSAGPALVYVGTNYAIEQTLFTPTSDAVVTGWAENDDDVQTGYYGDANLEYVFTDRAGLYLGAFYQTSGEYSQDLTKVGANYSTRLDLSSLQGLRGGVNFKF